MVFEEVYKKQVISLSNAGELGTVDGIYLDKDTLSLAALSVGGFALAPDNIVGKDGFLTVWSADALTTPCPDFLRLTLGQKALTRAGKPLGEVSAIITGRKNVKLLLGESPLPTYKIETASESYLIVNPRAAKPLSTANAEDEIFEIKAPDSDDLEPINVQISKPVEMRFEELAVSAPIPEPQDNLIAPDYSFLLGRKVEREISDLTRTFLISPGTIISEAILTGARKAGKIVDLAINSAKI